MATAIAEGSLLSSGGSALAGLSTAGTFAGISASTFTGASALFGAAGQFLSFSQGQDAGNAAFEASLAASRADLESARVRGLETDVQIQREKTQAAIEEQERQRRLRRTLAQQRAFFAGGSVDAFSGSPVAIQDATAGEINRESRLAAAATSANVSMLDIRKDGILAAGAGSAASKISSARTSLEETRANGRQQLIKGGQSLFKGASLIKDGGLNA